MIAKFGGDFTWDHKVKMLGKVDFNIYESLIEDFNLPLQINELRELLFEENKKYMNKITYMPGAKNLLEHLKKCGIPMAIASSSSRGSYDLKTKFDVDFPGYFHHCTLSQEDKRVKSPKPAPDVYITCRESFEPSVADSSSCLVFEDSPPGVLAGCRAGMQVVMVPNPQLDVQSFMANDADFRPTQVISSLDAFDPQDFNLPARS